MLTGYQVDVDLVRSPLDLSYIISMYRAYPLIVHVFAEACPESRVFKNVQECAVPDSQITDVVVMSRVFKTSLNWYGLKCVVVHPLYLSHTMLDWT